MNSTPPGVDWLLEYELRLAARYRQFFSFVLIRVDGDPDGLNKILSETFRGSDVCFREAHGLSVVMGETGGADAVQAIERYNRIVNGSMNLHYSVASYPSDGRTPAELRHVAQARLERARAQGPGAVVAEG